MGVLYYPQPRPARRAGRSGGRDPASRHHLDRPRAGRAGRGALRVPGLAAEISQQLESRLAEGCYAAMPDEESLATAVTRDLQSLNGDQHLRLLHSAAELPERGDEAAELAAMSASADRTPGGIARAERLDGNIGCLDVRPLLFPPGLAGEAVAAAMTLIAPTDALLIDVRRCLGGSPDMVAMLCSYLFGEQPVYLIDVLDRPRRRRYGEGQADRKSTRLNSSH